LLFKCENLEQETLAYKDGSMFIFVEKPANQTFAAAYCISKGTTLLSLEQETDFNTISKLSQGKYYISTDKNVVIDMRVCFQKNQLVKYGRVASLIKLFLRASAI